MPTTDQQQVFSGSDQGRHGVGIPRDPASVVEDSQSLAETVGEEQVGGCRGWDVAFVDADDGQDRGIVERQFEPPDHFDRLGVGHGGDRLAGNRFEDQTDSLDRTDLRRHIAGHLAQVCDRLVDVSRRREQHMAVSFVTVRRAVLVDRRQQGGDRLGPIGEWSGGGRQSGQQGPGLFQGRPRQGCSLLGILVTGIPRLEFQPRHQVFAAEGVQNGNRVRLGRGSQPGLEVGMSPEGREGSVGDGRFRWVVILSKIQALEALGNRFEQLPGTRVGKGRFVHPPGGHVAVGHLASHGRDQGFVGDTDCHIVGTSRSGKLRQPRRNGCGLVVGTVGDLHRIVLGRHRRLTPVTGIQTPQPVEPVRQRFGCVHQCGDPVTDPVRLEYPSHRLIDVDGADQHDVVCRIALALFDCDQAGGLAIPQREIFQCVEVTLLDAVENFPATTFLRDLIEHFAGRDV